MNGHLRMPIVWTIFAFAVGGIAGWQIGRQSGLEADARLENIASRQERAEASARSLVESLGRLCTSFDFYFKHDMARGAFRPVRCSPARTDRTVLFAYGFDTRRTQQAWIDEWGELADERGATLVDKGRWAVEVLDPGILGEVQSIEAQP